MEDEERRISNKIGDESIDCGLLFAQEKNGIDVEIKQEIPDDPLDFDLDSASPTTSHDEKSQIRKTRVTSQRKKPKEIRGQKKTKRKDSNNKTRVFKCRRKCGRSYASQNLLDFHIKMEHSQQGKENVDADADADEEEDPLALDPKSSQNRCIQKEDNINVYCRNCGLDFSSLVQFFDHLWNFPHPGVQDKQEDNDNGNNKSLVVPPDPNANQDGKKDTENDVPSPAVVDLDPDFDPDLYDPDEDDPITSDFDPKTESPDLNSETETPVKSKARAKRKARAKSKGTGLKRGKYKVKSRSKVSQGPPVCTFPECEGKTFETLSGLKSHKRRVHMPVGKERKFSCPFEGCKMSFSEKSNMKNHYGRIHEGTKNVICQHCGARFFDEQDLKVHQVKHNNDRKFKCKDCDAAFKHRATLAHHVSIHTGEKNYLCNHCGRTFRTRDAHRVHLRIHGSERMFKCPVCPSAHNHKATLKKHVASRHPEFEGTIP